MANQSLAFYLEHAPKPNCIKCGQSNEKSGQYARMCRDCGYEYGKKSPNYHKYRSEPIAPLRSSADVAKRVHAAPKKYGVPASKRKGSVRK